MNIKTLYITIDRVMSVLWLFISLSIYGCSSDEDILHTVMKDGNKLTISGQITYYDTEDTFLHSVSSYPINNYSIYDIDNINYNIDESYELHGYNQVFTGGWEMAKFGSWISQYGLKPNAIYYVATDVYVKYITRVPDNLMIIPKKSTKAMGYCPGIDTPTFTVTNHDKENVCILQTCNKSIKYDSNGNLINLNINNLNEQLTWKFLIQESVWE